MKYISSYICAQLSLFDAKMPINYIFLLLVTILKIEQKEMNYNTDFLFFFCFFSVILVAYLFSSKISKKNSEVFATLFYISSIILADFLILEYFNEITKKEFFLFFLAIFNMGLNKMKPILSIICLSFMVFFVVFKTLAVRDLYSIIIFLSVLGHQICSILIINPEKKLKRTTLTKNAQLDNIFNDGFPGLVFLLKKTKNTFYNTETEKNMLYSSFDVTFINKRAQLEYKILNSQDLIEFLKQIITFPDLKMSKNKANSNDSYSLTDNLFVKIDDFLKEDYEKKNFKNVHILCLHLEKKRKLRVYIGSFYLSNTSHYILFLDDNNYEEEFHSLKELDEKKDKMLISIAHDLRSPLNGILAFVGMAKKETDSSQRNNHLKMAEINGKLLMSLIEDILDSNSIAQDKFNLKIEEFSLNKILKETEEIFLFQTNEKNITFSITNNFRRKDLIVISDPRRLKQILFNCISNAIKFTHNGGQIKINVLVTHVPNILKFEIIDSGIGIKPEIIDKLGSPFATFDTNGINGYGIGFGLYLCKNLTAQLGPKFKNFHVSSIYGHGTKIGFLIFKRLTENEIQTLSLKKVVFHMSQFGNHSEDQADKNKKSISQILSSSSGGSRFEKFKKNILNSVAVGSTVKYTATNGSPRSKNKPKITEYLGGIKNTILIDKPIFKNDNIIKFEPNLNESLEFTNFDSKEFDYDFSMLECQETQPEDIKINNYYFISRSRSRDSEKKIFEKNEEEELKIIRFEENKEDLKLETEIDKRRINVLIVDDNPFNLSVLSGYLQNIKEFDINVLKSYDGKECLEYFKFHNSHENSNNLDIIFLDCEMPLMDGYTAAHQIKTLVNENNYVDCFIIATTGHSGFEEEKKCYNHGMNDFLTKPITEKDFEEMFMLYMKKNV